VWEGGKEGDDEGEEGDEYSPSRSKPSSQRREPELASKEDSSLEGLRQDRICLTDMLEQVFKLPAGG
jgi:hypothetical protein